MDHWAGETAGSWGEACRYPDDPPGKGRRRRPLPRRGGEWHERYAARDGRGREVDLCCARLDRLGEAPARVRRDEIAEEVALLAGLPPHPNVVGIEAAWLAAGRALTVATFRADRASLRAAAGGGRGPLYRGTARVVAHRLCGLARDAADASAGPRGKFKSRSPRDLSTSRLSNPSA